MKWLDTPPFDDVEQCHILIGQKKAQLTLLRSKVKLKTLNIKKENPRKPWLIEEATLQEQEQIATLESEIERLEAQKDFFNYWKDMNRSERYNNR